MSGVTLLYVALLTVPCAAKKQDTERMVCVHSMTSQSSTGSCVELHPHCQLDHYLCDTQYSHCWVLISVAVIVCHYVCDSIHCNVESVLECDSLSCIVGNS